MKEDSIESVDCVICGKTKLSKLKDIKIDNTELRLVKCKKCGLIFFSPRLKESIVKQVYEKDLLKQSEHNSDYINEDTKDFSKRLKIIEKYQKNKQSVLDIGCSVGTFLNCCEKSGFKEIYGTDLNKKTNAICRNNYGYNVSSKIPNKKFDLINMSDLIEHVYNPKEFLLKMKDNLNDKGVIAITTPNISNPLNKIINIKPEEHQYYFSKKTMTKLLNLCGYNITYIKKWNRYHSLRNLINTSTAKELKPLLQLIVKFKLDFLFDYIILKRLYTDLFIVAKKVQNK